jgi:hypothetical protein
MKYCLCRLNPPRPSFAQNMTEVESKVMRDHLAYWADLADRVRYEERESRFKELIRQRGLKITDELVFAWYNPPFMPWFLLRNEVLIPVAR